MPKETLKRFSWLVFNLVFLARLVLQQRNNFLTLEHVLLGDGQREQADVTNEGAPGVGSGERSFGWQRVVRLDHEVNGQQDQAQREQALREKTGSELMRLHRADVPTGHTLRLVGIKGLRLCATGRTLAVLCDSSFSCNPI